MPRRSWHSKFDVDREFVVRRRVTVAGRVFVPGELFDKTSVNTRRLRQLFDARTIHFTDENPGARVRSWKDPHRRRPWEEIEEAPEAEADDDNPELTPEEQAEADAMAARGAVVIPEGWEKLPWAQRLKLGASVAAGPVKTAEEVAAAIAEELKRRGAP